MKLFSHKYIPAVALGCGAIGFTLRQAVEYGCIDEKGLYLTGHPLYISLFVLSALVLIWLFVSCRKLTGKLAHAPSAVALAGSIIAASGILYAVVEELVHNLQQSFVLHNDNNDFSLIVSAVCFVLGILAAGALVFSGILQQKNKPVHYLFYAVLTVYLLIHPLSQYRMWSSDPQLLHYGFHLLASISLLLSTYHRAALAGGMNDTRRYIFFSHLALFFCCLSIQGESWLFYLSMALWIATNPAQLPEEENDVSA